MIEHKHFVLTEDKELDEEALNAITGGLLGIFPKNFGIKRGTNVIPRNYGTKNLGASNSMPRNSGTKNLHKFFKK